MKNATQLVSRRLHGRSTILCAVLISCAISIAAQQSNSAADVVQHRAIAFSNTTHYTSRSSDVLRVINDPGGQAIWLLSADPAHPSGPGRLERVRLASASQRVPSAETPISRVDEVSQQNPLNSSPVSSTSELLSVAPALNLTPVIRAGDPIIIEQHTATLDSTLSAIALGPARLGAKFEARLVVGGKRLHAIALAHDRAIFASEQEHEGFGGSQ